MKLSERLALLWAAFLFVFNSETKLCITKNAIVDFGPAGLVAGFDVFNTDARGVGFQGRPGRWERWSVAFSGKAVVAKIDGVEVVRAIGLDIQAPVAVSAQPVAHCQV